MVRRKRSRRQYLKSGSVVSIGFLTAGCISIDEEASRESQAQSFSVVANDQAGAGETVTVEEASAEMDYYVHAHYNNETVSSDTFEGGTTQEDFQIDLDPVIEEDTQIRIGIHAAEDEKEFLGETTEDIEYTVDMAEAEWSEPEEPNRPLERKDEGENRIKSVRFVDKEPAESGQGYSNFNIEVVANTSMENVDPPEHGDVVGEPYFFVKINEGADNQKIVERTDEVAMEENGTFHIDVRPAGLEEFGEREQLTVEIFLLDEDKDWDDVYDAVAETIHFNPDTDN